MVPVTTTAVSTPEAPSPLETRTTPALWRYALDQRRDVPAHLEETPDGWTPVSWEQAAERVDALGHALLARGVRHGDAVAVLARTRLEWVLLDWAIMSIGAVVVGLYPTNSAKECEYILGHSETVLAFAEDDAQREKLESVRATLPALRDVFLFAALDDLEAEGRAHRADHPDAVEEASVGDRRGRSRDAHLHVGDDRPAEGLHAHAQEPRRRRAPRRPGARRGKRRHPALPAARAQLRTPRAPVGRALRRDGRVLRRGDARARGAPDRPPHRAAGGPARLREDPFERARRDRAQRRREARDRPLGAPRRRGCEPAPPRRQARPDAAAPAGRASPTGSSSRRSGSGSAAGSASASPARRRSASTSSSSSTRSGCSSSRATGSPRPRARRR